VGLYTNAPPEATVVCVDELGPVSPRTFPPAPGWSPDGHRIKAPLEYSRGPDKVWVFGALRVEDGKSLIFTSRSRNSKSYLKLLEKIERAVPEGPIYLIADSYEIDHATRVATRQLNRKAKPWVWGRPPKPPRHRRRTLVYRL
jgi:hypothetical protein